MTSIIGHLSFAAVVGSVLAIVSLRFFLSCVLNDRKLRHFQGPTLARFSRVWMLWQSLHARVNRAEFDAISKHGMTCRIGPDILVTGDPDVVRHMNAPTSKWRRSPWYHAMRLDPRLDTVFSTRDEKVHSDLKAKEAGGYSGRDIDSLEPAVDSRIGDLLELLRRQYNGSSVDISSIMRYFTLDVLSTVAFGRPFGFLAANKDLWEYNKLSTDFLQVLELRLNHPFFRWLFSLSFVQTILAPKESDETGMGPMVKFAREAVAERFGVHAHVEKDMLGHFVAKGLSQMQCEAEASLQILAGSDSTTTVLRSILFHLGASPGAYAKLRIEIEDATATHMPTGVIAYAKAQKLPYLSACIWEGLRMYPPLFGLKSKIAPLGGDTIKGVYYPEGVEVAICDDAICRNKTLFGHDANIFRPERWLEADAPTYRSYYQTVDTVFGSGRYLCLGKHIAMMEIYKTIFELVRHFDWMIVDPMKGIDKYGRAHGVHIQSGMNMVATVRT
ncbi:Hypothetical protein R9X50_00470200 [Acrodontium crateriforme]|uniref:Cytochrome P450 n=1 Tax=Acrodontium crateriforme TaxID=150365 RepID=A0AAQ3M612_9PEZI|nr:Hypothetical protein R9X50_00470200 [Acrodontium crateriforme]